MNEPDHQIEFLLAQYDAVREEVKWIIAQTEAVENFALATSGGIWAWLLPNQGKPYFLFICWLPLLVSSLFLIKRFALWKSLKTVKNFILKIETYMKLPPDLNYESSLKVGHFQYWRDLFWSLLIIGNAALAIVVTL